MSSRILALILAALAVTAGVAEAHPPSAPQAAGPPSHACAGDPISPQPGGGLRVRHLSCAAARTAITRGVLSVHACSVRADPCSASFHTPGFRCQTPSLSVIRCARGRRGFSFWWGE